MARVLRVNPEWIFPHAVGSMKGAELIPFNQFALALSPPRRGPLDSDVSSFLTLALGVHGAAGNGEIILAEAVEGGLRDLGGTD